jgi:uncharacterized protein (TIGR02598 family)
MKLRSRSIAAFSLVEVTLALGIAAFCLIAVVGLVPVGVQTNRNATSQTAATNILSSVVSDLRGSPPAQSLSSIYLINRRKTLKFTVCFDGQAKPTGPPLANDVVCTNSVNPNSVYRLYVQFDNTNGSDVFPAHAYLRVTWPALAIPSVKPSGSVETVTAFFYKAP